MRNAWRVSSDCPQLQAEFGSLDKVFALDGRYLSKGPVSEVIRVECQGVGYYVKRYLTAGSRLRRYWGLPRVKTEWRNLQRFQRWGIPTAPLVAWGMETRGLQFVRGALITQEIPQSYDLAALVKMADPRLNNPAWVRQISHQLAVCTRIMHVRRFTHNDLKWRNLLVNDQQQLFFIDCPTGAFWWGSFLQQRIVKDLACLDKVAKYQLSRSQRLRFYLDYCQVDSLSEGDKLRVRAILKYFEGRE